MTPGNEPEREPFHRAGLGEPLLAALARSRSRRAGVDRLGADLGGRSAPPRPPCLRAGSRTASPRATRRGTQPGSARQRAVQYGRRRTRRANGRTCRRQREARRWPRNRNTRLRRTRFADDDLGRAVEHPAQPRHDVELALARAPGDVLLEPGVQEVAGALAGAQAVLDRGKRRHEPHRRHARVGRDRRRAPRPAGRRRTRRRGRTRPSRRRR